MNAVLRWRLKGERLALRLDQPRVMRLALWGIPLLFGLLAVKLGQDYNFDLRNYHLYNAFAFLNGKVGFDLAPAQMQTYFNPTIDLLYYGLINVLPGPLAGFVMGTLQGLNFILLVIIAQLLLPAKKDGQYTLLPLMLALAGMLGNAFLSEFGNTMGDNLTALAVLGALVLLLRAWPRLPTGAGWVTLLAAGSVMGVGVGLKLTVAVFALALCASLLAMPLSVVGRVRASFLFGVGVLFGLAITGGHWYFKMWSLFGNPLFPQFGSMFPSPLAAPIAVSDTRFLPHGLIECLLWPLISLIEPSRISEIEIANPVWSLLYLGGIALVLKTFLLRRPVDTMENARQDGRIAVVTVFVVLSYIVWMLLFSIYRYLVPIELLAPLMLWLLAHALLPRALAGKIAVVLLLVIIASNFPRKHWGYAEWASTSFKAETPVFTDPSQSMVLTVLHDAPMGWLVPMFPKQLAFASLNSSFPESEAYRRRVAGMVAARSGPLYAMMEASGAGLDTRMGPAQKAQAMHDDRLRMTKAIKVVSRYSLSLDPATCVVLPAYMGKRRFYYQLCRVRAAA